MQRTYCFGSGPIKDLSRVCCWQELILVCCNLSPSIPRQRVIYRTYPKLLFSKHLTYGSRHNESLLHYKSHQDTCYCRSFLYKTLMRLVTKLANTVHLFGIVPNIVTYPHQNCMLGSHLFECLVTSAGNLRVAGLTFMLLVDNFG